jgi:DNA-binding response OmpR family regulator
MQLRLFAGILLFLVLLIPAAAASNNPYQKIAVIDLAYGNGGVNVVSSEIQYGIAPDLNLQSGSIQGLLLDSRKETIGQFSIRDPRIQTGDIVETAPDGTVQGLNGYTEYNPRVEFGVIVPFTPDLRYVNLVDTLTGDTLVSVDLTGAVSAFQQLYPDDPDIKSSQQPLPASFIPAPGEFAAILGGALIAISGAGYFSMVRRPRPIRVMIVDDEPAIVEVFSLLLSQKGYVPIPAQSGKECISLLKIQKKLPDLILLDIMMVPMDGWQTLEEIKKNPSWKKIPVLMLTGKQPTPSETKRYGLCIEDYMLKPIKPQELYLAIEYVLMRKKFIEREVRVAIKAGFEKEIVCEYARLRTRVEVEKKLLGILRSAYAKAESVQNESTRAIDDVSAEIGSREEKLKSLQSRLSPVLTSPPVKRKSPPG